MIYFIFLLKIHYFRLAHILKNVVYIILKQKAA